jgi:outer membrane protein
MAWGATVAFIAASALGGMLIQPTLAADTLETALGQSYYNNPQLNAQRAAARVTDENVAIALGGYRPRVSATGSLGEVYLDTFSRQVSSISGATSYSRSISENAVQTYGATVNQTLFNGFQTGNRTRQAESQVLSARELLRTTEQTVLLNAATAYMNLLRDTAILELQRSNVTVLEATLRQTRDRFNVGEVTRTDVAQSESSLAAGRSSMLAAVSKYTT